MSTRLAVYGDVHGAFDPDEARALDGMGYDGVLFVGDLGTLAPGSRRRVARAIGSLRTPTLVLPGNHDGPSPLGILREAVFHGWHPPGSARRLHRRTEALARALEPVPLVGYATHPLGGLTVASARPWAMDGRRTSFDGALERRHGVSGLADSAARLRRLLASCSGPVVVLAHNGPAGLGARPQDPWSLDGRDAGDPDLAAALTDAPSVRAVVAGHMHLGSTRDAFRTHRGILHVNAAEVPRRGRHVELVVDHDGAVARWVHCSR